MLSDLFKKISPLLGFFQIFYYYWLTLTILTLLSFCTLSSKQHSWLTSSTLNEYFRNDEKWTQGCWMRSANATSVLFYPHPPKRFNQNSKNFRLECYKKDVMPNQYLSVTLQYKAGWAEGLLLTHSWQPCPTQSVQTINLVWPPHHRRCNGIRPSLMFYRGNLK